MRIGSSFQFELKDKGKVICGIGTIFEIEVSVATRNVWITFKYTTEDGIEDQLIVDLSRFYQIVKFPQQTL